MTTEEPGNPEKTGHPGEAAPPRRTKLVLLGVGIVAVIAAVLIGWTMWPRGTTEITHEDALASFRKDTAAEKKAMDGGSAAGDGSAQTEPTSRGATTPDPGVYTYDASGSEQVKLGPFPTEDRPLPATVTIVVADPTQGADGTCFVWTLNLFAEHTETTTWCVSPDGTLRMTSHTKRQSVGALSPTATLSCDPDILIAPGATSPREKSSSEKGSGSTASDDAQPLECNLKLVGGPAAINARMVGTSTTSSVEQLTVGTRTIDATPVVISYDVSGDLSGTWTEELWLDDQMLPVRIKRDLGLTGPATLTEHSTLDLTDLSPSL